MKIERIQKMKSGKYKIEFDNRENMVTYDDVILKNDLLYHQQLAEKELNQLEKDTQEYDIYYKCLKFISKKIRSEKEIRDYVLKLAGCNREDIMKKLKQQGLINDKMFASAFIYDKIHLSNEGILKIKKELEQHQIDEKIIYQELSKYKEEELDTKLKKLLQKKIKAGTKYSRKILKQK